MWFLVYARKRRYSDTQTRITRDVQLTAVPDDSPPCKRNPATTMSCSGSQSITEPPVLERNSLSNLDDLVRDAHVQYHDNLRALKRDVQLMVLHFARLRDDRIAFYTRGYSHTPSVPVVESPSSVISHLTQDLDLDIASHDSVSVSH